MGKNKTYRGKSRQNKYRRYGNPCGCYYCCGNPDKEHNKRKLFIQKHKSLDLEP